MPKEFTFPDTEENKIQDEIFRKMDGSKRIEAAFGLTKLAQRLTEAAIKEQHPGISATEVKKEFARRAYLPLALPWKKRGLKYSKG